ncbi:MAG: HAD family hydrolase [Silicimonas sp.]|nr:HAD family hydrolase [Silicimonas sp.]NND42333.1 HAD family hydrolase [Silicimonas sp.]
MNALNAIVFDKDGTLFDFQSTWSAWYEKLVDELCPADDARQGAVADALRYQPGRGFYPDSVVIAGTSREVAETLARETGLEARAIEAMANRIGETTPQQPVPRLSETLAHLASAHVLGLVTNDGEAPARAHLGAMGIGHHFSFVAGYDSGHGAKPEPGQLLAFSFATGIQPSATLMVGDSRHDLAAGRAAGMATAGVLTGVAGEADLSDLADVVLPDISHLPEWIAARR